MSRLLKSPAVHVQELVLDQRIDNSLSQALTFFSSVAPSSPPYPRHIFSPLRSSSGNAYNISRELKARISQLELEEDTYTDSLTGEINQSPNSRRFGSISSDVSGSGLNSLFHVGDDASLDKYMQELDNDDRSAQSDDTSVRRAKEKAEKRAKRMQTHAPYVS